MQAPHHSGVDALYDLDDRPFPAPAPVHGRLAHHHAIAVEDLSHLVRAEVQIRALLGGHEAVAVGMALDAPGDEIELGGDQDCALAIAQDLAVALHRAQALRERVALRRLDREALRELLVAERHAALRERPQNELAARDRMLVARRFAFAMRVGCACDVTLCGPFAEVAELVDALGSGPSGGNTVGVRVPSSAPNSANQDSNLSAR